MIIPSGYAEAPTTFCDLVKNPERYDGKEVTVRATWGKGYEWSVLYCLGCSNRGSVMLELRAQLDDASKDIVRQVPMYATANVTVQGLFMSHGPYGPKKEYQFQLVARHLSDAAIVWSGDPYSEEGKKAVKKSGCGGTNPD